MTYGSWFCVDGISSAPKVVPNPLGPCVPGMSPPGPLAPLASHVGTAASVSLVVTGVTNFQPPYTAWVAEVHGAGYCPNSETHNKQADTKLCDQVNAQRTN